MIMVSTKIFYLIVAICCSFSAIAQNEETGDRFFVNGYDLNLTEDTNSLNTESYFQYLISEKSKAIKIPKVGLLKYEEYDWYSGQKRTVVDSVDTYYCSFVDTVESWKDLSLKFQCDKENYEKVNCWFQIVRNGKKMKEQSTGIVNIDDLFNNIKGTSSRELEHLDIIFIYAFSFYGKKNLVSIGGDRICFIGK